MDWQTHTLPTPSPSRASLIGFVSPDLSAGHLPRTRIEDEAIHLDVRNSLRISSPGKRCRRGNVFLTGPSTSSSAASLAVCRRALPPAASSAGLYKARPKDATGMGLGDVKLLAMIAAFLGFWPAIADASSSELCSLPFTEFS